jgi:ribonuclease D
VIDTAADLEELARALAATPAIGIDTEGDGLYRYRARLCTIQIAFPGGRVALVDTLALGDRSPLIAALGSEGPEKVLHDCAFDARLLAAAGLPLRRVFDTSIAARFLGEVATGLATLLEKNLGVKVSKDLQQADWGIRPLSEEAIAYLEEDVRYLLPLAEMLRERCREAGILDEVLTESAWATEQGGGEEPIEDPRPAWIRIKGATDLRTGAQRAVLRELASLRERIAEEEDVPPFRVMPNAALLAIARRAAERPATIASRPDLEGSLRDAVARGLAESDAPEGELLMLRPPPPPLEVRELRKKRESALSTWRTAEAAARGVHPQVVLPGHCLRELAGRGASEPDELLAIGGIGQHRVDRYGAALIEVLASIAPPAAT